MSGDGRLTREQEQIRLKGLRLLARIIVRAHLRSLIEKDAERHTPKGALFPNVDIPEKGGKGVE